MSRPCFLHAISGLLLCSCATLADAPSASPAPVSTPIDLSAQRDVAEQALFALPPGLDLKAVHIPRTEVLWKVDVNGRVLDLRFTPTGSRDVDSAIRTRVIRRSRSTDPGAIRTVPVEYAHVYLFPNALPPPATGPMIPMEPATQAPPAPSPPAPAGDRTFPVLANDPSRLFTDPTPADFPGLQWTAVEKKVFQVSWRVDETGTVTDVEVTPGDVPAVGDGLIHHFFSLRYWPAVHNGKPTVTRLSHTYSF